MEREAEALGPLPHPDPADGPRSGRRASRCCSRALPGPDDDAVRVPVFQSVGYYGFGTLVPLVLASKGYSVVTSLTFTSLTFIGYPIGSALSLPIVERIDRRWLIVASASAMSVLGSALGYALSPMVIVAVGFLYTAVSNVFSNALHIFQVEIFRPSPGNRGRRRLRAEPAVERGDAVRAAAGPAALGRRCDVRRGRGRRSGCASSTSRCSPRAPREVRSSR